MNDEADRLESDPGALAVARRLAALDLAADSRVRSSLRAKLLARCRRPSFWESLFPLRLPAGLAAACAAAAVMLMLLRPQPPAPAPVSAPVPVPAPAAPTPIVKAPAPAARRPEPRSVGVFVSIPAASPFESHGKVRAGYPFVTVPGSALESRAVRIEELFVKPTL